MLLTIAILMAFGLRVLAVNQTVSVFLPIIDAQPLVASLVKVRVCAGNPVSY